MHANEPTPGAAAPEHAAHDTNVTADAGRRADWMVALNYTYADSLRRLAWEGIILDATQEEALEFARRHAGVTVEHDSSGAVQALWHEDGEDTYQLLCDAETDFTETAVELASALATNVYLRDEPEPFSPHCDAFEEAARLIGELAAPPEEFLPPDHVEHDHGDDEAGALMCPTFMFSSTLDVLDGLSHFCSNNALDRDRPGNNPDAWRAAEASLNTAHQAVTALAGGRPRNMPSGLLPLADFEGLIDSLGGALETLSIAEALRATERDARAAAVRDTRHAKIWDEALRLIATAAEEIEGLAPTDGLNC